jgi:hypothetical protein
MMVKTMSNKYLGIRIFPIGLMLLWHAGYLAQGQQNTLSSKDLANTNAYVQLLLTGPDSNSPYALYKTPAGIGLQPGISIIKQIDPRHAIIAKPKDISLPDGGILLPVNNLWKLSQELLQSYIAKSLNYPLQVWVWRSNPQGVGLPYTATTLPHAGTLAELLEQAGVLHLATVRQRTARPEELLQRYDPTTNHISFMQTLYPGFNGSRQRLSLKERLPDTTDIDLHKRRMASGLEATLTDNHATQMATLILGNGNSGFQGRGVSPAATYSSVSFSNLLPEPYSYYRGANIGVQNHSYGVGIENEYATDAAAYDLHMWTDTTVLHIFSAGNLGNRQATGGRYNGLTGWSNLSGSFKMSKNSLSIGATDSFYRVEALSSRGPAYDGRIKPELVAFGTDGSSGAAALTSGTALTLTDALSQRLTHKPAAALVKAILIHTADDIGSPGPSYTTGYGSLNTTEAIMHATGKPLLTGVVSASAPTAQVPLNLLATARQVKITLAWTDTSAVPGTTKSLVNDLDLMLLYPDGTTAALPWVLSQAAHPDSLQLPASRGTDHTNPVEQILVANLPAGLYTIAVSSYSLHTNRQPFALVWQADYTDSLYCTAPHNGMPVAAGSTLVIRWKQTVHTRLPVTLRYEQAGSNQWHNIATVSADSPACYRWAVPDSTFPGRLQLVMDGQAYYSQPFLVTQTPQVQAGYQCTDTTLLYWPGAANAALDYRIWTLGDTLMQHVGTTLDTLIKLPANLVKNNWVRVDARHRATGTVHPGNAINLAQLPTGCFVQTFLAEWQNREAVLKLTMGSYYQVTRIAFEKKTGNTWVALDSVSAVTRPDYTRIDKNLLAGTNYYRIRVNLATGNVVYSDVQTVVNPDNKGIWVYPNPLPKRQQLTVVNRIAENEAINLNIYDARGRNVGQYTISLIEEKINLQHLPAGLYMLQFTYKNKAAAQAKLLIGTGL